MAQQIIIKRAYFDNIKVTIDAINEFFSSQFKVKEFPSIESDTDVDITIANIVDLLNNVEPSWIDNPDKVESALASINESLEQEEISSYTESVISDRIFAYIGYKVLLTISENFDSFSDLLNGIYTFDIFMNPDKYTKSIEKFSQPIDLSELAKNSDNDEIILFDIESYVNGIFSNKEYINTNDLDKDEQIDRMKNLSPTEQIEVVVDDSELPEEIEESYAMEAATDVSKKPVHILYDESKKKFIISNQLKSVVDHLISDIEGCETTEDLKALFSDNGKITKTIVNMLVDNESPFIINKVLSNPKKSSINVSGIANFDYYIKKYENTISKNAGAARFFNYDIFSTFKVDKSGTVQFLKDFFNCEFVNNELSLISNNTLLTLFNIFDSREYYTRLWNAIPEKTRNNLYPSLDGFVKQNRSRLNKLSHSANIYNTTEIADKNDVLKSTDEIQEFVYKTTRKLKDCTIEDMHNVDLYQETVNAEISMLENLMYNSGMSQIAIAKVFQEMEMGDIPDYMKERLNISDKSADTISVSPADTTAQDSSIPDNSFDDLATSIDNKINSFDPGEDGGINDMLGMGYEERREPSDGKVVYNITNNYNYSNSFNKNSGNTMNDSSQGKTVTINNTNSNNDSSTTSIHHANEKLPEEKKEEPKPDNTEKEDVSNINNNSEQKVADTITSDEKKENTEDIPMLNPADKISVGFDDSVHQPDHTIDNIDYDDSKEYNSENEDDEPPIESSAEHEYPEDDEESDPFSNGMSVHEFFSTLMEVAEPLSDNMGTVNNQQAEMPEENTSTHILDVDLKKQKKRKEFKNSVNAMLQPAKRVKAWIKEEIEKLVKMDENKAKAEILENDDYRHKLHKIARFAIKCGAISLAYTINGYIGTAVLAANIMRSIDKKERLTKEVQEEFATELAILKTKIADAEAAGDKKAKWQMMRLQSKMEHMMADNATRSGKIKTSKLVN